MRFHSFFLNFLFLLFAFYFAQGSLYTSGSILSQFFLILLFLISGFYFVKTLLLKNKNSFFYIVWTVFLIVNIIGFIFTANLGNDTSVSMFKAILGCMLPFYPFYYFAKKDILKPNDFIRFLFIILPVTILQFFTFRNNVLSQFDRENVVNNIAYLFVGLIPFVFFLKKQKLVGGAIMMVLMLFIIQGAKRGALIAGLIGLLVYFYFQIRTVDKRKRIQGYIIAALAILVIAIFVYKYFSQNEFLQQRIASASEGDTSKRNIIYETIFNAWFNSQNFGILLFGFGFAGSLMITGGRLAHNDWLELLSNFGIAGVCMYLFLFYAAVKYSFNKSWGKDKRILMFTITLIWFFISLVSMWYTSFGGYTYSIVLAYLVGSSKNSLD